MILNYSWFTTIEIICARSLAGCLLLVVKVFWPRVARSRRIALIRPKKQQWQRRGVFLCVCSVLPFRFMLNHSNWTKKKTKQSQQQLRICCKGYTVWYGSARWWGVNSAKVLRGWDAKLAAVRGCCHGRFGLGSDWLGLGLGLGFQNVPELPVSERVLCLWQRVWQGLSGDLLGHSVSRQIVGEQTKCHKCRSPAACSFRCVNSRVNGIWD